MATHNTDSEGRAEALNIAMEMETYRESNGSREQKTGVEPHIDDDGTSPRKQPCCSCCPRRCCGVDCSRTRRRWIVVGVVVIVVVVVLSIVVPLVVVFSTTRDVWDIEYNLERLIDRQLTHRYPSTEEDFAQRKAVFEEFLKDVESVSVSHWSDDEVIRLDILKSYVKTFVDGHDWWDYGNLAPFPIIERHLGYSCDSLFGRDALANRINGKIAMMRRGLMLNRTAHNITAKNAVEEVTSLLNSCSNNRTTSRLRKMAHDKVQFDRQTKSIVDSLTKMALFLEQDYLPHLRTTPGLHSWPNGLAYYNACLRWHIGLDLGAQELHDLGNAEIRRIKGLMQKLLKDFQFSGTIAEFKEYRNGKKQFFPFYNEKMLFDEFRNSVSIVKSQLHKLFRDDISIGGPGFTSLNKEGVYLLYSGGMVYVNTTHTRTIEKHSIMPLTLHEAFPGHHYQIIVGYEEVKTRPKIHIDQASIDQGSIDVMHCDFWSRRARLFHYMYAIPGHTYDPPSYMIGMPYYAVPTSFPYFTSFTEGWGLYSEYLGVELGVLNDPYDRYGAYEAELLRAGRLVYDTGINAFGWTLEEAKNFLTSLGVSDAVADTEVLRSVKRPGRLCSYKTGEIYLKKLRAEAKVQLGSLFDNREFHHTVLNTGERAPLVVVKKAVDMWVSRTLKATRWKDV